MPEFAGRSCADCQEFVHGANGVVSVNDSTGQPHRWADFGGAELPCGRCPKRGEGEPKVPLPESEDLYAQDWFWGVRRHYLERRACGPAGPESPFMREVMAECDEADRRAAEVRLVRGMAAAVVGLFKR